MPSLAARRASPALFFVFGVVVVSVGSAARAATRDKRGRSVVEGGISFSLCVYNMYLRGVVWNQQSCFSSLAMQIVKGLCDIRFRLLMEKKEIE